MLNHSSPPDTQQERTLKRKREPEMSGQNENLPPNVIKRIILELRDIAKDNLEGIKVNPNEADVTDILATIDGPEGTPYAGGHFKVKLKLGPEFPSSPPKAFFMTKIFHPNVSDKGEICVNTLKKDWKENLGIKHILLTIKCLMIYPNPDSALNPEASRLLQESYDDYVKHAAMITNIHAAKPKEAKQTEQTPAPNNTNGSSPVNKGESNGQPTAKKPRRIAAKTANTKNIQQKRSLKRL